MAKERTGWLRWSPKKKSYVARVPVFQSVDGVRKRVKVTLVLGTADANEAGEKLRREVAKSLEGELEASKAAAPLTVDDFAKGWIEGREARGIAAVEYEKRYFERVWSPAIGRLPLKQVGTADIRKVLQDAVTGKIRPAPRKKGDAPKPYKRQSIIHMRATIVRLLQAAWKDDLVADNKAARVEVPEFEEEPKARAVLTDSEIVAFVQHPDVDGEIKLLVLLSRTVGGLRAGDLNALDWLNFTPDLTHCTLVRRKTRKKKRGPETHVVPEAVRRYLHAWWDRQGRPASGPVFPVRRGDRAGQTKTRSNMSYAARLRRELLRAGIDRHELHHETPTTLPVDFHSSRRAFATAGRKANMTTEQIKKAGAWSSEQLIQRYDVMPEVIELPAEATLPLLTGADGPLTVANPAVRRRKKVENTNDSGAGHAVRTRDPELGKLVLYQLS